MDRTTQPFVASPASAYRADMAGRGESFGPDDEVWLSAASSLHLAATATGSARRQHLFEALGAAIDLLGDEKIDAYVDREWQGDRMYVEAAAVLAESVHRAGALHLAALMLDDLLAAAPDLSPLDHGRILWLRARLEWRMGHLDQAANRYEYIASLGRKARRVELEARAEVGLTTIAQLRGNLPDMRMHAQRAIALAEKHGFAGLARFAYLGLTTAEAKQQHYDEALISGWKVVQLSRGDPVSEAEGLQNIGQLMLEAGHFAIARASFSAVMTRSAPSRLLLNALGGLALASAQLANEATVEWSVREVWRAQQAGVPRYELAVALLECGSALQLLGRADEFARYNARAHEIARADGYHELEFRAADLAVSTVALTPRAAAIAGEVSALEPKQLPIHVEFEAASA